jgi:ATP-binding cassette, subfamily F, member 3
VSLVVLDEVSLHFGPRPILDEVSARIGVHDRIGLVGPNGSGKTTLLRVLAGEQELDGGQIIRAGRMRIGYLPQDLALEGGRGLLEFVLASVPGRATLADELAEREAELADAEQRGADPEELMDLATGIAEIHERIDHFERFYTEHEALRILAGLGFQPEESTRDLGELSGGWKMRAVLAGLLFQQPDLMLLDEPTNHLDMPSVAWFNAFLRAYSRAFLLISHDREFLNGQIDQVWSFEPEGLRYYRGDLDQYAKQREEEATVLEAKARNLGREKERMEKFVNRFRAQATKARAVQSRVKALEKMEDVELYQRRKTVRFRFPPAAPAVGEIIKVDGLRKAYGDHVVFDGVDLAVRRGQKIGIIGPNGAGKTTLLKIVAGELRADGGNVRLGSGVQVGYYAQHHTETLHRDWTVYDEVKAANPDASVTTVRNALGGFLFGEDDIDKPIAVLSGGEKARVALARLLVRPANLLLMDEPTNHLDLASAESLAASLADFDGTLVFVSHNLSFVRRVASVIWSLERGVVEPYPGTLDEYLYSQRIRRDNLVDGGQPVTPEPAAKRSREDDKERKRREAEQRNRRSKVLGPLEKKVAELEERISGLEVEQATRSAELSDPAVYADATRRRELLTSYQKGQEKLDELNSRWEAASTELDAARTKFEQDS